ncbi:unnamed protein product [Ceutorhynchus assimilis]|uniref:Uncharacterized protein n=1 Tax=Ceutorhynchus assimilis TaxID=467358 RepID=A0A9P0DE70_9CUCU|nr:unnamed protein product [Ceutorhynchus assimilis]
MAPMRKIITLHERDRQLATVLRTRDIEKLKSIVEDYQSCGEFTPEFYTCLYKLCDRQESDDEMIQVMLGCSRLDVNEKQSNGETILHALSRNNHYQWVEHLIKVFPNIDVNAVCKDMKTPFLLAAEYGHIKVLEVLDPIVEDISCCDIKQFSVLHWMARHGSLKWVKYLIEEKAFEVDQRNAYGDTPLNRAIAFGQYECCQYLLEMGANVLEIDMEGRSLLHTAVFGGHLGCCNAVLKYLKEYSYVYVNLKDNKGKTALNWAAGKGYKELVICLLEAKADVNYKEPDGRTALVGASMGGYEDIIKLLIDANANIDVYDGDKKYQPLTRAASNEHMGTVQILLDAGANVNITDDLGMTALDWASSKDHEEMVYYLLQRENIDVNSRGNLGNTPLMRAAKRGNVKILRALIEANACVDLQNSTGDTALILAVIRRDLSCVVELVKNNAKLDLKNYKGETALMISKKFSWNRNITEVLQDAGAI